MMVYINIHLSVAPTYTWSGMKEKAVNSVLNAHEIFDWEKYKNYGSLDAFILVTDMSYSIIPW